MAAPSAIRSRKSWPDSPLIKRCESTNFSWAFSDVEKSPTKVGTLNAASKRKPLTWRHPGRDLPGSLPGVRTRAVHFSVTSLQPSSNVGASVVEVWAIVEASASAAKAFQHTAWLRIADASASAKALRSCGTSPQCLFSISSLTTPGHVVVRRRPPLVFFYSPVVL
jgi:hypothetical protein